MIKKHAYLIKATAYLRYSDNRQEGNHSLEIQKANILMLAEKEGLEIVNWCIDESTSAFNGDISTRAGVLQVIEDIKNGAEAVCFYEESRLTRQITDFYFLFIQI